jgi:hypothetical protein
MEAAGVRASAGAPHLVVAHPDATERQIWALLAALPILASLLPFARAYLAEHDLRWGAEVESGANALVVLVSAWVLGDAPGIGRALITIPLSSSRLAAVWFALASIGLLTSRRDARGARHLGEERRWAA